MYQKNTLTRISSGIFSALLGFALMAVLLCFFSSSSQAKTNPHPFRMSNPARNFFPTVPINYSDPLLSPEQNAVLQWILDSSSPKLGVNQARQIVLFTYQKAQENTIDPMAYFALMRLESRFNPYAISSHGARGLMQVMPHIHKDKLKGRSPYDIETSISVGAQILNDCMDRNDQQLRKALNCYSGGGGQAYASLFQHFHKQANRYIVLQMFDGLNERSTLPAVKPEDHVEPLPTDESVYLLAQN